MRRHPHPRLAPRVALLLLALATTSRPAAAAHARLSDEQDGVEGGDGAAPSVGTNATSAPPIVDADPPMDAEAALRRLEPVVTAVVLRLLRGILRVFVRS